MTIQSEVNRLLRRVTKLEVTKDSEAPPLKPEFPAWMETRMPDVQAIVDDLADRVITHRGDYMDPGWFAVNQDWEGRLPYRAELEYFLRGRLVRSPKGHRMLPHAVACELVGLVDYWIRCDTFEAALDAAWQALHYLPPASGSRALVERLWHGVPELPWCERLNPCYVPLPGQGEAGMDVLRNPIPAE